MLESPLFRIENVVVRHGTDGIVLTWCRPSSPPRSGDLVSKLKHKFLDITAIFRSSFPQKLHCKAMLPNLIERDKVGPSSNFLELSRSTNFTPYHGCLC